MKIYAYRKNELKGNYTLVLDITKDDFDRLQSKLNRFVLLNNYEKAKKLQQCDVKVIRVLDLLFTNIGKFLKNNDMKKHFTSDNVSMKFQVISYDVKTLSLIRPHLQNIFKIFDSSINVNNITYNDNECSYVTEVI